MLKFFLLAQAGAPGADYKGPGLFNMMIPMILMFVIMYVVLIRPQQRKQKEHDELVKKLKAGDKVVTNGGIHGTIAAVKDKTVLLRVADNFKIEINRANIGEIEAPETK